MKPPKFEIVFDEIQEIEARVYAHVMNTTPDWAQLPKLWAQADEKRKADIVRRDELRRQRQMRDSQFPYNVSPSDRDGRLGPFKVLPHQGRGRNRKIRPLTHKVVNNVGRRVHRGSYNGCQQVCDLLNLEHAKWIMLKP